MSSRSFVVALLSALRLAALANSLDAADSAALAGNSTGAFAAESNRSSSAVPLLRKGAPGGAGAASTSEPVALDDHVHVTTFFWNVHWQCSVGAQGSSGSCKDKIGHRFVQLAKEANAQIVTSIELSHGMSQPVSLVDLGLSGWTQVDGPCQKDGRGDSAALAFAPGWQVQKSGGGCLRHDYDTRAFAVARVAPPSPVRGCESLCVVALHAPHTDITAGRGLVSSVCGDALASTCTVAMGDWNVPVGGLGRFWSQLIGGPAPALAAPNERTCCFPESHHYGVFDHVATNIAGAQQDGYHVYPYQLLEENPVQEHKPVRVSLALPAGR